MSDRGSVSYVFVDVREPEEFASDHVEGAVNVPPASLLVGAPALSGVPKDATLVVYCRTGSRSRVAINYLNQLGFSSVVNGINQDQVEAKYL